MVKYLIHNINKTKKSYFRIYIPKYPRDNFVNLRTSGAKGGLKNNFQKEKKRPAPKRPL
jgi:hypothetical protein